MTSLKKFKQLILIIIFSGLSHTLFAEQPDSVRIIPKYNISAYDQEIMQLYRKLPTDPKDINQRIVFFSQYFLGRPYLLGALGEGPEGKFDQGPLYRTDAFDCMTYVATVLALVQSHDLQQFRKNIVRINYFNDQPSFLTRNHFTTVDWNIKNQKNGFIKDITQQLFPKDFKIASAYIERPAWFKRLSYRNIALLSQPKPSQIDQLLSELHQHSKDITAIRDNLPYVPLTALYDQNGNPIQAMFDRIPSPAIIEIVRPNWYLKKKIGTNLNVSHLGFGLRINGQLIYREASSIENKVMDVPLAEYLKSYLTSSTVKGIHIEKIL